MDNKDLNSNIAKFLEALKVDTQLQNSIASAGKSEEIIATAKAAGFDLSEDDLNELSPVRYQALFDSELEQIAGGANQECFNAQTCTRGNNSCKINTIQDTPYRIDC